MKRNVFRQAVLIGLVTSMIGGCGGQPLGRGGLTPVTPVNVSINTGEQKVFRARSYQRITSVQWTMEGGPSAGTLEPYTSLGRFYVKYTAPATPGQYWIRATIVTSEPHPEQGLALVRVVPD